MIQLLSMYLPIMTAIGVPLSAIYDNRICTCLMLSAILSTKSRVNSSYIHRLSSSMLAPHDGLINPFEVLGDITSITKDDYSKAIIMVAPHGPTFYPSVYYGSLFEREFGISYTALATPALFKIPFAPMIMSGLCNIVGVDPTSLERFLEGNNGPGVTYPGGFEDVFANSADNSVITINVNPQSLLFHLAVKNGRCLIPTLVLNETAIFTHAKKVVQLFQYVHKNYTRTGIPVPPLSPCGIASLVSTEKMILLYGSPVYGNSIEDLAYKYLCSVEQLHQQALEEGLTTKPLVFKVRGTSLSKFSAL